MEEDTAPFGQREGHRTDSAENGLDARGSSWSTRCSATVDADVGCVRNCGRGGGDSLSEAGHGGFVENGAIGGGVRGSCWDVIGSNGVA